MKVWDAIIFNDEMELWRLRAHELRDVVDYHVVVEADTTFSGEPKPLRFLDEWNSSLGDSEFADKVIHVVVRDMPVGPDPWAREHHQRNSIMRGLTCAEPDGLVLMSDADEVPHPDAIGQLKFNCSHCTAALPATLAQLGHYYWLNMRGVPPHDVWYGTRACPRYMLNWPGHSPQELRAMDGKINSVRNGGWHFSFLGGAEKIRQKVAAYSHHDLGTAEAMSDENLLKCLETGDDLFGRDYIRFHKVPVDDSFPRYVLENRSLFDHLIRS